jgi:hypothetical protein
VQADLLFSNTAREDEHKSEEQTMQKDALGYIPKKVDKG